MSPTLLQQVARTVKARDASGQVAELFYLLRHLIAARGSISEARHAVEHDRAAPSSVASVLRAPVNIGQLTDSGLEGGRWVLAAFSEAMRSASAFDAILAANGFIRVPIDQRGAIITSGASAGEIGEGRVKFVSQPVIAGKTLRPRKVAGIIVISEELARSSAPSVAGTLGRELTGAVGAATDLAFVNMLIAAGIPVSATAGSTSGNTLTDIGTLLAAVQPKAASRLFFITTTAVASKLAVRADDNGAHAFPGVGPTGGTAGNIPFLVSDGVPAGLMLLVDGSRIIANSDEIKLDTSTEATLQMDSSPDSPAVASTVATSLWQHDLVGMRADRFFGAEALTTNAGAAISGM